MNRGVCLMLATLALGAAGGVSAEPRLTLRLENVTLHETLRQLSRFYGRRLTTPEGAGGGNYRELPDAARGSFDWREAGVGVVYRDIATRFRRVPARLPAGAISFESGAAEELGLLLTREGLAIALRGLRQQETREQSAAAAPTPAARSVTLLLAFRVLDGDPQTLYSLDGLRARDSTGLQLRAPDFQVRWAPNERSAHPDEWLVEATLPGPSAAARELASVEGDVVLYRLGRTERVEAPLAGINPAAVRSAGPVQIRRAEFATEGGRLGGSFVVVWPPGVEADGGEASKGGVVLFARLASGDLRRLALVFGGTLVDERGEHSAEYTVRPADGLGEVESLVWDVTARANPDRRVGFRFSRVPLPLAPAPAAGPEPAHPGTASLLLRAPLPPGRLAGELSLGLSRKVGKTWGPVRWSRVETDEEGHARLDDLAPGAYRIQANLRPRDHRGDLGPTIPLTGAPLNLTAGRVVVVALRRR